ARDKRQRHRRVHGGGARQRVRDGGGGPLDSGAAVVELQHGRRVADCGVLERADVVVGIEAQRNGRGRAVVDDGPREALLLGEFLRNRDGEDAYLAAGKKVRGLSEVRTARVDVIIGADRNVDLLAKIAVVVTDEKDVTAA